MGQEVETGGQSRPGKQPGGQEGQKSSGPGQVKGEGGQPGQHLLPETLFQIQKETGEGGEAEQSCWSAADGPDLTPRPHKSQKLSALLGPRNSRSQPLPPPPRLPPPDTQKLKGRTHP